MKWNIVFSLIFLSQYSATSGEFSGQVPVPSSVAVQTPAALVCTNCILPMGKTSARGEGKSSADRKFDKKLEFYEKVRAAVTSKAISKEQKQKKRSRQKKLKAYDLTSLTECLPELKAPSASAPVELKLNCKRRNDLVVKESNKLKMVINHPVYQSDPLAAIYQHLQTTQPAPDKKPKKKDGKARKSKTKKKKSKDTESMDI